MPSNGVFSYRCKTFVLRFDYDCAERRGCVFMPNHCSTDMSGTIELFCQIDPAVRAILTYAGDRLDTCYRLRGNERVATPPPSPRGVR